jgi:hypothetical protein
MVAAWQTAWQTVHLARVLAAESTAAVRASTAVGPHHNNFPAVSPQSPAAADDRNASGVDQIARVLQPFLGQRTGLMISMMASMKEVAFDN